MGNETNETKGNCSSHKGCCCGSKLLAGVLIGLLLLGFGFYLGQLSQCPKMKYCPIMEMQQK